MIYKYCTTDGFDILLKSRLKAGRIEDFNDPFEMMFGVDEKNALDDIKKEYEDDENILNFCKLLLNDQKIEYDINFVEDIIKKVAEFQTKDLKKNISKLREDWNKQYGIVCLSELADVIQMWAHYTDNHRGIVIGFDKNQLIENEEELVKVCYKDEMVLLPVTAKPGGLGQYEKYIVNVLESKESNWQYEKEVRLYVKLDEKDADGNYYVDIPSSSIREIYLGLRSHETTEVIAKSIQQRTEYRHLKIYKMKRHESALKLVPEEL